MNPNWTRPWPAVGDLPNITIPDANDGWDIAQALVYAVVLVGGAIIVFLIRQVLTQVKNSHSTNMRDDLDAKFTQMSSEIERVNDKIDGNGRDIKAVHQEVRDERTERRSDVQELREDVSHKLNAIQRSLVTDAAD